MCNLYRCRGSPDGVIFNVPEHNININEFDLQLRYNDQLLTTSFRKGMKHLIPTSAMGTATIFFFFTRMTLALNSIRRLICH